MLFVAETDTPAAVGCGNVGDDSNIGVFQRAVGRVGKQLHRFHAFHSPVIPTAKAGVSD